jgi:hypothetical protein
MPATLPIVPRLKSYSGPLPALRRQAAVHNLMAKRVTDHLNRLIANDPEEEQIYSYDSLAKALGLDALKVRSVISHGGTHALTVRVLPADRKALRKYKARPVASAKR